MKLKKFILINLSVLLVLGCAAAGVPYTNDPMQKINNGYALMNQGRAIPADKLGKEALASFQESGDTFGTAEAHIFLGQLYKSPAYRQAEGFFSRYNEYDPTNQKSVEHSEKAVELFLSIGNYTQAAKGQFAAANGYLDLDRVRACNLYDSSLASLEKGKKENPEEQFYFNPNYKSAEEMINAFKAKYCVENPNS